MARSDYLCFTANSSSTIRLSAYGSPTWSGQYSTNGSSWSTYTLGTTLNVSTNGKVYFRGTLSNTSFNDYIIFSMTGSFNASGNVMSLSNQSDFATRTSMTAILSRLFSNCDSLMTAPELPATTLVDYSYYGMFYGCTSLIIPPELPATTLTDWCYDDMFARCSSLISAPELPATTLAEDCYQYMFANCTSLTTAPELPATTLAEDCYYGMFYNCTSLTTAPELPATTLAEGCYKYMFSDCTNIKLSATQTGNYTLPYRIPSSGTGTTGTDSLNYMFSGTGGTFVGTPSINTTYYQYVPPAITTGLCFESNSGTSTVTLSKVGNPSVANTVYSNDGINWNTYTFGTELSISGSTKLYFRNDITGNFSGSNYLKFVMTGSVKASGNINSMYDADDFDTLTTLSYTYCYYSMFQDCTSLTTVPSLPATTLSNGCYREMFYGCTSLTTVPSLPATTLANYCYNSMFNGCTGIKLSATRTLAYESPYRIPSSGTGTTGTDSLYYMFSGTGGTFTGTPSINTTYYLYTGEPEPTHPSINKTSTDWQVTKNGTTTNFYIPSAGIKIEHENVAGSDSGRTQDGIMHIDWVRRDVVKLNLEWKAMTQSELNTLVGLIQGQEFTFKFPDRGSSKTISAYCGKCSYNVYTTNYRGLGEALYTDISVNIIEM